MFFLFFSTQREEENQKETRKNQKSAKKTEKKGSKYKPRRKAPARCLRLQVACKLRLVLARIGITLEFEIVENHLRMCKIDARLMWECEISQFGSLNSKQSERLEICQQLIIFAFEHMNESLRMEQIEN